MNKIEALERLHQLREKGVISEEEFQAEKEKILSGFGGAHESGKQNSSGMIWGMEPNTFLLLLHLSQLLGLVIPLAGLVMPLILWLTNKDQFPVVNKHGTMIANWMITTLIGAVAGIILSIIFIGFLLLIALAVCNILFIILGAVSASKGEYWPYPMRIQFIPEPQN